MDAETHDIRQARLRASIKWLLSKAFNNRIPDNLREPYYRDNENQERLKPQIIVELGNATLYCQTLSNLYSDPNYQSLNHWSILQTLARKGVPVSESPDMPLTETVLIQTNPLKINAHIAVIEALMILYAKEISSGDRISNAIKRISGSNYVSQTGHSYEQSLLSWVAHSCASLKNRITKELETEKTDENMSRLQTPDIPVVRDYRDLCDGIGLALLLSYYCPKIVPWTSVRINYLPAVEDSIYNILIVSKFSQKFLPYNVFHMTPEDIAYMRGSIKLNLVVLLADLFNLLEIHPAKCVAYPGMDTQDDIVKRNIGANECGILHRRGLTMQPVTPIPDLRSELELASGSPTNRPPFQAFIVHKSRGITTLSSLHSQQQEPVLTARHIQSNEMSHVDTKSAERGDIPAGRPSNWDHNRRPSYAGRRSRRNSSSEDSQLTIENFGGSQDQLNNIGRFERERERKVSNTSIEPAMPARCSIVDARGTLQLGYDTDSGSEKQDYETEKHAVRYQGSGDNGAGPAPNKNTSVGNTVGIGSTTRLNQKHQPVEKESENNLFEEKPSAYQYDAIPQENCPQDLYDDNLRTLENASKLCTIRMKLEEKQRRIEQDKRKIESSLLRHQEKATQEDIENAKWETLSNDSKRTPDIDPVELDKYQQSIAIMNMNLQDIQQDIQRLATQQTQIQAQQMQAQQLIQAQQIANMLNQQQSYGSQQHLSENYPQRAMQQHFGSTPHIPQIMNTTLNAYNSRPSSRDPYQQKQNLPTQYINEHGQYIPQPNMMPQKHFMQHLYNDGSYNNHGYNGAQYPSPHSQLHQQYMSPTSGCEDYMQHTTVEPPNSTQSNSFYLQEISAQPSPQRRTWSHLSYEQQQPMVDVNAWQAQNFSANSSNQHNMSLHQNGEGSDVQHLFQVHSSPLHNQRNASGVQRQQSMINLHDNRSPNPVKKVISTPAGKPSPDDMMAPQSICFIGDEDDVDEIERNIIESMQTTCLSEYSLKPQKTEKHTNSEDYDTNHHLVSNKMNINSGNLTYRIPSPSRPYLHANSFQDPRANETSEKGFYISFDDDQPKRPKPPLRTKRSPKKENNFSNTNCDMNFKRESLSQIHKNNDNGRNLMGEDISNQQNHTNIESNKHNESNATYNKYTDPPISRCQLSDLNQLQFDRRHLEDVTNHTNQPQPTQTTSPTAQTNIMNMYQQSSQSNDSKTKAIVIGTDVTDLDPESVEEMERRKEKIMLLSLQRRQQQEEVKARKEIEAARKRERDREKEEERTRKKEEQVARRAAILEQHRLKKALEEAEREGKTLDRSDMPTKQQSQNNSGPRLRQQKILRRRPNTIHVDDGSMDLSETSSLSSRIKKSSNLAGYGQLMSSNSMKRDYFNGSQDSLTIKESPIDYPSTSSTPIGRRGSYKTSREPTVERDRTLSRISVAKGSTLNLRGRKSNSLMNLCDSGLGRATPPRRAPSPGITGRHMTGSGPGSLPPGLISKRRGFDDGSSDVSSTQNSMMEYAGPKLYKQPAAKSNRGIILNAVEYCVFPGAVNRDAKQKVLEKIARSEAKHFLVLFRDAGCQFRALYSFLPETEQVCKLYGTGPSQVDEAMFDKFFKYNSGGKCFSQVHTKHLTVTIDAFTIHNSLWQGKKVQLPSKRDMALVI